MPGPVDKVTIEMDYRIYMNNRLLGLRSGCMFITESKSLDGAPGGLECTQAASRPPARQATSTRPVNTAKA